MYGLKFVLFLLFLWVVPFNMCGCTATNSINTPPDTALINIPLLEKWSGDYPVSELGRLPEEQQGLAAGYIGDTETFITVWRAFMPGEILPAVDFSKNIVFQGRASRRSGRDFRHGNHVGHSHRRKGGNGHGCHTPKRGHEH
jgi:hypothetical protein